MISKGLYEALKAWKIECDNRPTNTVMEYGLCDYVRQYEYLNGIDPDKLYNEMMGILEEDFPDNKHFPFEEEGSQSYFKDHRKNLNPLRRNWVESKLAEYHSKEENGNAGT